MKTGIGVVSHNRPEYLKKCLKSLELVRDQVDYIFLANNGDELPFEVPKIVDKYYHVKLPWVSVAKNILLKYMMHKECDYMFLVEDDMEVVDPKAISGYIEASKKSGFEHLNFAHHGAGNKTYLWKDDVISYYPDCVGSFSMYTPKCIEKAGYMDERFKNAYEHVFMTKKIGDAALTSPFWMFADATGSNEWIHEQPGSSDNSSIPHTKEWEANALEALRLWKEFDGVGLPPHE